MKNNYGIKYYFFMGILVTAPLFITVYLIVKLVNFIDDSVVALIPENYHIDTYIPYDIPFFGVILLFALLVCIGMLATNFVGEKLTAIGNALIAKIPFISGIYGAIRKIFETILGRGKETAFRQAVLVQYPRKDLWTVAFVAGSVYDGIQDKFSEQLISIYVPTTPNPTSGFLIYVPKKDIIPLDIGVDEAFKMVVSTAIINPKSLKQEQKKAIHTPD